MVLTITVAPLLPTRRGRTPRAAGQGLILQSSPAKLPAGGLLLHHLSAFLKSTSAFDVCQDRINYP
jgi:hypothetical protein